MASANFCSKNRYKSGSSAHPIPAGVFVSSDDYTLFPFTL